MLITANGLVTRSYQTGDHDRIIHLLTEEHGRLSVMVKGRSTGGKNAAAPVTQLFTYGNYELYRGKGGDLFWFRGGSVLRHFFEVTRSLSSMALATYLCDVADTLSEEENVAEAPEVLRMLLNTLHTLAVGEKSHALVKGVFELRLAALMGYQPDLTACARCGEGFPEAVYLDIMNGRLICADCQTELNRLAGSAVAYRERELGERRIICPLSASALAGMRYALASPDRKIFSFALTDPEDLRSFSNAAETYLLNQLEQDFDSLQFYRSVAD